MRTASGRSLAIAAGLLALLGGACGDDKGGSTGSTTSAASQGSGSGGQECEAAGGTCHCVDSCAPGSTPAPALSCPQPGPSAGACSMECCLPDGAMTTAATEATSSGASTATSAGEACSCADLPACTTPEGEDCGGMYPTGQCCDEGRAPFHCACPDDPNACTGGYPCCVLAPGCA